MENYDWQDVERRMLEFLDTPENRMEIPSLKQINYLTEGHSGNIATLLCLHLAVLLQSFKSTIR